MKKYLSALLGLAALCAGCSQSVEVSDFGKTKDGQTVKEYVLKNSRGTTAKILDYGAIIRELRVADRNGKFGDIVLGFDNVSDYETKSPYFGAVVGRYGNRIADGKFSLDGREYNVSKNEKGITCLHGGAVGFDKKIWKAETRTTPDASVLKLTLVSPDGDQGFPGNLKAVVVYTLDNNDALTVEYSATTDKPTVCNLTNHSYFNLAGAGEGTILNQELALDADKYTVVDQKLSPTGELRKVDGTPFDFRKPEKVGARINASDEQIKTGRGYDHNFVFRKGQTAEPVAAASLYDPASGRLMVIETTEPAVQFYSGNGLDGVAGKEGKKYVKNGALALETQHYPDSPNQKDFPSTTLRPNEQYKSKTVFKFSTK